MYYLFNTVFPETMKYQGMKITSSGQALGGSMLFDTRIGFSGTPSDLLPEEFQPCLFEKVRFYVMQRYFHFMRILLTI